MAKKFKTKLLILLLALCSTLCVFTFTSRVIAAAQPLELIITGPGENASTEMLFTWRSSNQSSTFYYSSDFDACTCTWEPVEVKGTLENTIFTTEKIQNYRFELKLEGLEPGTEYSYYITSGSNTSDKYYFQTAYETGDFNFLWVSDNHAYPTISDRQTKYESIYKEALEDLNDDIPLVVSTGDDVSYGGNYDNWQTLTKLSLFKNVVFASTPGNHTCYEYGSSNMPSQTNQYFEAMFNTPENGTDEASTSYYFLYNSVLFITLDSIVANSNGSKYLPLQRQMFIDAVEKNEGKYQYIIVLQHYPFMDALTGSKNGPYGTNYGKWYELFDEYGVDLALSGDHHCYYRSKTLKDDKIVTEGGTMYIGAPQIGGRHREITDTNDAEYYESRITSADLAGNSGATYFTVTSEGITGTLIDTNGTIHDTYTVQAKRPVTWESEKAGLSSSINIASSSDKTYLCFENKYAKYVDTLEVFNGNTKVLSVSPYDTKQSAFELSSLEKNKAYNLKIKITYSDHTSEETEIFAQTYGYIGEIYKLEAKIENSKLKVSWNATLEGTIISNFKVYADNELISTLAASATSCEIDLSKVSNNTVYTLEAVTSQGDILYRESTAYTLKGDASFDGVLDEKDIEAIINGIKANTQYGENALSFLDFNENGEVDLGDAFTINAYVNLKLHDLYTEEFTVTIINLNGEIILQEKVKYGDNASFTSSSYYLSSSIKHITKDTTAIAVAK